MDNNVKFVIVSFIYIILEIIWITSNLKMYNSNTIRIQGKLSNMTNTIILYIIIVYLILLLSIIHIAIPLTLNNIKEEDKLEDKIYKSILDGGRVGVCIYGI